MPSNIVGCDTDTVAAGVPLLFAFFDITRPKRSLPLFTPRAGHRLMSITLTRLARMSPGERWGVCGSIQCSRAGR